MFSARLIFNWSFRMYRWYSGDALHGIGQRHDGLLNVSRLCVGLRVISGIHWIALHIITSLLCVGLLILPLGRKALKRNTSEKQSALTNA